MVAAPLVGVNLVFVFGKMFWGVLEGRRRRRRCDFVRGVCHFSGISVSGVSAPEVHLFAPKGAAWWDEVRISVRDEI